MKKNFAINALGYIDFNGRTVDLHSYCKLVSLKYDSLSSKGRIVLAGRSEIDPLITINLNWIKLFKAVLEPPRNNRSIGLDLIVYATEEQEDCFMLEDMLNEDLKYSLTVILENESVIFVNCESATINMDGL